LWALLNVLPDEREKLGANGRSYVEREFSWAAVLNRFDAAIERLLAARAA